MLRLQQRSGWESTLPGSLDPQRQFHLASSVVHLANPPELIYVNDTAWFCRDQVLVDGSKFTHAFLRIARCCSPLEEAAGATLPWIRAHPIAMASSGLPRAERGH